MIRIVLANLCRTPRCGYDRKDETALGFVSEPTADAVGSEHHDCHRSRCEPDLEVAQPED